MMPDSKDCNRSRADLPNVLLMSCQMFSKFKSVDSFGACCENPLGSLNTVVNWPCLKSKYRYAELTELP
jgi:hypothetical protein